MWVNTEIDVLQIFAEVQSSHAKAAIDEMIRQIGCQRLMDTVAKQNWAAKNKEKQREYTRRWYAKLTPERRAAKVANNKARKTCPTQ